MNDEAPARAGAVCFRLRRLARLFIIRTTAVSVVDDVGVPTADGGRGEAYSFVARLRILTIDHASLSRREHRGGGSNREILQEYSELKVPIRLDGDSRSSSISSSSSSSCNSSSLAAAAGTTTTTVGRRHTEKHGDTLSRQFVCPASLPA
ncbi:unnamed protein product [Laminaria digitata]